MVRSKKSVIPSVVSDALDSYNAENGTTWNMHTNWSNGDNWSNKGTEFETFINDDLFPKIRQTTLAQQNLGSRFDWLAKEVPDVTTFMSEDYVIADSVPTSLNLSKGEKNMLRANYPHMLTKLYAAQDIYKQKFTLNDNDAIIPFSSLGDAINYALAAYKKRISDINYFEECNIKAMLVDYSLNQTKDQRTATSQEDLVEKIMVALLDIQDNSANHNEAYKASGAKKFETYTTYTDLNKVMILTNNITKQYILDSKIANTFQIAGLDITDHIVSFEDLGGTYQLTKDVEISTDATVAAFQAKGLYETEIGDTIYAGTTFTFDPTFGDKNEFSDALIEIKPQSDLYASVWDVDSIGYKRNTQGMIKQPTYLAEEDAYSYWIWYRSQKYVRPFFNHVTIQGTAQDDSPRVQGTGQTGKQQSNV